MRYLAKAEPWACKNGGLTIRVITQSETWCMGSARFDVVSANLPWMLPIEVRWPRIMTVYAILITVRFSVQWSVSQLVLLCKCK